MNNIQPHLDNLQENPLFQMSLGSKELFHSNFLAWILESDNNLAKAILNDLGLIDENEFYQINLVEREKFHVDVLIYVGIKDKPEKLIIIENKLKSIPYPEQLDEYKKVINKNVTQVAVDDKIFVLLSLTKPNFDLPKSWMHIGYDKLSESIFNQSQTTFPNIKFFDSRHLLSAYADFTRSLHEISENLKIKNKGEQEFFDYTNTGKNERKEFEKIRIHDLYLKLKHQQISNIIIEQLYLRHHDIEHCDPWRELKEAKKEKRELNNITNKLFIKEGFSNSNGMIDFKYIPFTFTINKQKAYCAICIQLQGDQLRYALEFMGNFSSETKRLANKLIYDLGNEFHIERKWFVNAWEILKNEKLKSFFSKNELQGKTKKKNQSDKDFSFCKFGDTFIYKYNPISSKTYVSQVVNLYAQLTDHLIENKGYFETTLNNLNK